jgi:hypothetical protein
MKKKPDIAKRIFDLASAIRAESPGMGAVQAIEIAQRHIVVLEEIELWRWIARRYRRERLEITKRVSRETN